MTLIEAPWWHAGERIALSIGGVGHSIFVRVDDRQRDKPWLTLLHGFPSSSWDWHKVWPTLAQRYRLLALDLLGYGASDKSPTLPYSTSLHADTVHALWSHCGIERTHVVGHDIGTAVVQELLARRQEQPVVCDVEAALLINGAVFIDHYRPNLLQRLLMSRLSGPLISITMNERRFVRGVARAFAPETAASPDELAMFWRAMAFSNGQLQLHRLLHHIPERVALRARWEGVLRATDVPLRFVWGRRDPFVGFVAEDIRRHLPRAPLTVLDVGHFPQLEAPDAVVHALLT